MNYEIFSHCNEKINKNLLLMAILKQNLLSIPERIGKEAASIRHKLEEPLCHKFFNEVPALKAAFWAPLCEKGGKPWVEGSVDFITIIEEDGLEVEVTEIKTQTSLILFNVL